MKTAGGSSEELFSDILVEAHPERVGGLFVALESLVDADSFLQDHLKQEPDVEAAEASGDALARVGLRPAHVAQMLSALSRLFDRIHRRDPAHAEIRLRIDGEMIGESEQNREAALRAARDGASISDTQARALLKWLLETVDRAPLLVAGYEATRRDDEQITFRHTQEVIGTSEYGRLWNPPGQDRWSGDGASTEGTDPAEWTRSKSRSERA